MTARLTVTKFEPEGFVFLPEGEDIFLATWDDRVVYVRKDVVEVTPAEVPQFNRDYEGWHYHHDPEVRYFERGGGTFWIRKGGGGVTVTKFYAVAERSFIRIPANTVHRFQANPEGFKAHRLFTSESGGGIPIEVK